MHRMKQEKYLFTRGIASDLMMDANLTFRPGVSLRMVIAFGVSESIRYYCMCDSRVSLGFSLILLAGLP